MATFLSLYNEVEYKIKQAIAQVEEYKTENERLKKENERLQEKVDELDKTKEVLEEKYKLLTITQTILKKEDKKATKKKINDLVREIDNCIGLLSQ